LCVVDVVVAIQKTTLLHIKYCCTKRKEERP
jgi:hypothetical protein